ncbi:flagellar protein FlgN [Polaromonas sp.]|uniref:flagella synthesis protein FlgN n=1 Tax=Polaromonas sp. TaxID=1869339 RepID=UPI0013BD1FB1|nr:flagellar protein FlgN [Polaromonas sp.]NDP65019.1 flagellar protein FlgN [Polaromonas sp.]
MTISLLQRLTREDGAVAEFLVLLNQEADAMAQGRFMDLPLLAEHKSQLADRIAILRRHRENEQMTLGYGADRSGAEAAATAGGPLLQDAWRKLQANAAQAHERNHANGVMIHTHLDFTRQSINFLKSAGRPLYGPDGSHYSGSASGNRLAMG